MKKYVDLIAGFPREQEFVIWKGKGRTFYILIDGYGLAVSDGWSNDRFIIYDDLRVAYDFPERLPKYIKDKVSSLARRGIIVNRGTNMINNKIIEEVTE